MEDRPAGDDRLDVRAPPAAARRRSARPPTTCSKLSRTSSSRLSRSQSASELGDRAVPLVSLTPDRAGDPRRDEHRVADRFERDEEDAVGEVVGRVGPRAAATAGSCRSRPARSASAAGSSPGGRRPRRAPRRGRRTSSAGSAGCWAGRRACGAAGSRTAARRRRPGRAAPGARRSLSRCSPRSRSRTPGEQVRRTSRPRVASETRTWPPWADRGDPCRPVDVEPDEALRRVCSASPVWRPIRTRIGASVGPRLARPAPAARRRPPRPRPGARRKTTKNESPSVPCSIPPCAANAVAQDRAVPLEQRRRSASRADAAARGRSSPRCRVNRKVYVPRVGGSVRRSSVGSRSARGQCRSARRSARAAGAASPRRMASATPRLREQDAPRSPRSRARGRSSARRRRPGRRAAGRRAPTARRRSRPGPSRAIASPSRTTRTAPVDDDEEPGPDLALAGDDVLGREVDLDRDRGDAVHARRRRRRRTARASDSRSVLRSRVRVMRSSTDLRGHAAPGARPAVNRAGPSRRARVHRGTMRAMADARSWSTRSRASRCSPTCPTRSSRASSTCSRRRSSPRASGSSARA